MLRRTMLKGVAACAIAGVLARPAGAQEVLKMGISIPMTGAASMPSGGNWPPRSSFTLSNTATRSPAERSKLSCATMLALPIMRAALSKR